MSIKTLSWILILGVVSIVLLYAGFLVFVTWPISEYSIQNSGVFGDSFGLLTSLFSGLAFAGLIITILMQREELALQRQELNLTRKELIGQKQEMKAQNETLKVQRFENTFFKMLDFLESCRSDIFYQGFNRPSVQGRDAIKALYESLTNGYFYNYHQDTVFNQIKVFKHECKNINGISEAYNVFYDKNGDELGQYYRTLYNIIKLVNNSEFIENKFVYTNLVRAQLSRYELLLLFYNSLSNYGSEKMAPLVKKYNILKHLEGNMVIEEHKYLWDAFKIQNN